MVTRDQVTYAAGGALILALSVLYGIFEPAFVQDTKFTDEAFLIAASAWIVGYVNCKGFSWADNNTWANALFAASWILLLGMEFTAYVPEQAATYDPWFGFAAIAIHMASYGITVMDVR